MTASFVEKTLVEEETDVKSKEYVLDIFKSMYEAYLKKFKEIENNNLSDTELADKFADNILPGFFDFAINSEHKFGSVAETDISNFLSIKHGCWLNTIDYMNKYPAKNIHLATGFIVNKDDLAKIKKDLDGNYVPVYVDLIPHGFIVDDDGDVFDPTLGLNEDYHYFYQIVEPEIWKTFKYFYNNSKDWWVGDFSDWTLSRIREAKETKAFYKFVGLEEEVEETPETPLEKQEVEVQVRNARGELVSHETVETEVKPSDRDESGVETTSIPTEEYSDTFNFLADSFNGNYKKKGLAEDFDPNALMGDFDQEENIPSDKELEERIDKYIEKSLGEKLFVANKPLDIEGLDDAIVKKAFINKQINLFGNKIKDAFYNAVAHSNANLRNTTSTVAISGIGTLDAAAKTFYSARFDDEGKLPGAKTSRSKPALGIQDNIPFYMTYMFSFLDEDENVIDHKNFEEIKSKAKSIARTLSIVQPNPVYQYRISAPSSSIINLPVAVTDKGLVSTKDSFKAFIDTEGQKFTLYSAFVFYNKGKEVPEALGLKDKPMYYEGDYEGLSYVHFCSKYDVVKQIADALTELQTEETKYSVVFGTKKELHYVLNNELKNSEDKVVDLTKVPFDFYMPKGYFVASNQRLTDKFKDTFEYILFDENNEPVKDANGNFAKLKTSLDDGYKLVISDNLYLYKVRTNVSEERENTKEDITNWLTAVPDEFMKSSKVTLSCVYVEDNEISVNYSIHIASKFPEKPKVDYSSLDAYKRFLWLSKEYDKETRSKEYDLQKHRVQSSYDMETSIAPFFAITHTEVVDFSEEESQKSDSEWIAQQLCDAEPHWDSITSSDKLLYQLFKHYSISLLVKMNYFLDDLQIFSVAASNPMDRVVAKDFQGILDLTDAKIISEPVYTDKLDNYTVNIVTTPIVSNMSDSLAVKQADSINISRKKSFDSLVEVLPDKLIEKLNVEGVSENTKKQSIMRGIKGSKANARYGILDNGNNSFTFYQLKDDEWKEFVVKDIRDKIFEKLEITDGKITSTDDKVVSYFDESNDFKIEPVDAYIDTVKDELISVRESFDRGTHLLYADIANIVLFGMNHNCYKNGQWVKLNENSDQGRKGLMNILSPIAFGVENYDEIVEKLNTYYRLPASLFPETSSSGDLVILLDKLKDCHNIMHSYYEKYNYQGFHFKDKNTNKEDEDSDNNSLELELNSTKFYVDLYSEGAFNGRTELAFNSVEEQKDAWNRFSQHVNIDIYPQILEDEYHQLVEAARTQHRGFVKIRMTTKMKEFSDRVTGVPFDFTTKSILFTALRNNTAVSGIKEKLNEILKGIKNGETTSYLNDLNYLGSNKDISFEERSTIQLTPRTSKEMSGSRNIITMFLRQMIKLKNSPEFSFINKLLYQDLNDEQIWDLRESVYNKLGMERLPENNKDEIEKSKEIFVQSLRQLVTDYQGYSLSQETSLKNKIASNQNYCLRDINIYYKNKISDIISSIKGFIYDLEETIKTLNKEGKETTALSDVIKDLVFIIRHKSATMTEDKISAFERILSKEKVLGKSYYWLLSTLNDLNNNFSDYKEYRGKLTKYIKDEISKYASKEEYPDELRENIEASEETVFNEVEVFMLKNLMSTWSVSMFDGFKKDFKLDENNLIEETTSEYPFAIESKNNPKSPRAWKDLFKLDNEQFQSLNSFLKQFYVKHNKDMESLNIFRMFTKGQLNDIVSFVKEGEHKFKDAESLMDSILSLQEIAEKNNIVSFSSVGNVKEPVKTNFVYPDDISKDILSNIDVKKPEDWIKSVRKEFSNDEKELITKFVNKANNQFPEHVLRKINSETLADIVNKVLEGKSSEAIGLINNKFSDSSLKQRHVGTLTLKKKVD